MTATKSLSEPGLVKGIHERFLSKKNIRRMRRFVPHPQLWAKLFDAAVPCSFSASRKHRLNRPESIQVSRSGDRIVVSNSGGRTITVYDIDQSNKARPKLRLIDEFADDQLLHYVHGATFACSDKLYLAVGEYSNTLSAVSAGSPKDEASSRVFWTVEGIANGLDNPADIAIHPSERYLVIANRRGSGLCFFSIPPDLRSEPPKLVLSLTVPVLNKVNAAAPHGVAFSADGRYLFVTHKPFFKSKDDNGNSAITVYRADGATFEPENWVPLAVKDFGRDSLHHIACHPADSIIAFTNSRGPLQILSWDHQSHEFSDLGKIDVFRQGEGAKGICFTPDGGHLAVTSELNEVLFFGLHRHVQLT